jgi:hypothetical protein
MKDCSAASCLLERPKFRQISLFPDILCSAYLLAPDSPKSAFYRIWIESDDGVFTVCKESGGKDKVLDQRAWPFDSLEEARKLFDRRVRYKTNPERKSPRKYILVYNV